MKGDIRSVEIRREEIEDGQGGHIEGTAVRIWIDADTEGDCKLAATFLVPAEGETGGYSAVVKEEIVDLALKTLGLE